MNPTNQQGYYQPDQNQPARPVTPPQPTSVVQPIGQPTQVDPVALQAALAEPASAPVTPAPQSAVEEPVTDEDYDEDDEQADAPVTWVAKEYIHQEKGTLWFTIFAVVLAVLLAVSIFLMNSWSFAVLLGVIAVVVVVYSRRPPRELTYSLTDEGLTVDQTLHPFTNFKSFGVIRDGEEFSVMLIPTRRFQPGTTVYFPEEAGEDIVDILGSRLPMRDLHLDVVDRVVRLLRL